MDELIKQIDDHIVQIDREHATMQRYSTGKTGEVQAAYLQAKSMALLAKATAMQKNQVTVNHHTRREGIMDRLPPVGLRGDRGQ